MPDATLEAETAGPTDRRLWIVMLGLRSSVRLRKSERLTIGVSGPASDLRAIRIGNDWKRTNDKQYVGGLRLEAAGYCSSLDEAATTLGNAAFPYAQTVALAANGEVFEDYEMHVFAPPTDVASGYFATQKNFIPYQPAARVRSIRAEDLSTVVGAIDEHADKERIHRAMAHYRLALEYLRPMSRVLSAEALFVAVEALTPVVLRRLFSERGLNPESRDTKEQFAFQLGFSVNPAKPTEHLSLVDAYVRREHIFDGNATVYRNLKDASDHFEHSSRDFGFVRKAADASAEMAFSLIRRAILRELGIPASSRLLDARFERPLSAWYPGLLMRGSFDEDPRVAHSSFTEGQVNEDWPVFLGLNLRGWISEVEDDDENQTRHLQIKTEGTGASMLLTQRLSIDEPPVWILPEVDEGDTVGSDFEFKVTKRDEAADQE